MLAILGQPLVQFYFEQRYAQFGVGFDELVQQVATVYNVTDHKYAARL